MRSFWPLILAAILLWGPKCENYETDWEALQRKCKVSYEYRTVQQELSRMVIYGCTLEEYDQGLDKLAKVKQKVIDEGFPELLEE
jgi:hypothetical protein